MLGSLFIKLLIALEVALPLQLLSRGIAQSHLSPKLPAWLWISFWCFLNLLLDCKIALHHSFG